MCLNLCAMTTMEGSSIVRVRRRKKHGRRAYSCRAMTTSIGINVDEMYLIARICSRIPILKIISGGQVASDFLQSWHDVGSAIQTN